MLTYTGTIDTGSLTLRDACSYDAGNLILVVDGGNTFRTYNTETLSQVGSNISVTSTPYAVTMLNSASAVVAGSSSTIDLLEVNTGHRTTHSGGSGLQTVVRTQRLASDPSNNIAIAVPSAAKTLVKFNGNTYTTSTLGIDTSSNDAFHAIIFIGNGRYIVGSNTGHLYEIDDTGKIYKQSGIERVKDTNGGSSPNRVWCGFLSYWEGFLLVSDTISTFSVLIDWTTGQTIKRFPITESGNGLLYSNSASGHVLVSRSTDSVNSTIHQVIYDNTYAYGFNTESVAFTGAQGFIVNLGINTQSSKCWALQETIDDIRVFTLSASSATTTRVFSSPNNVDFRLSLLDVTDGQGNVKVFLDTYTTSPRTLTVPTGRTFIEIIKIGTGTDAQWDCSKYVT